MAKKPPNAISPTRDEDYPEWYQQVIKAAELAEASPVRGCMVIQALGLLDLGKHAAGPGSACSRRPDTRMPTFRCLFP